MFKETTIELYDRKLEEITGTEITTEVNMCFDVSKVVAFREVIEDGESEISSNRSVIYLMSGESFGIDIPYKQLKALIN